MRVPLIPRRQDAHPAEAVSAPAVGRPYEGPKALGESFDSLRDPRLVEFLRGGGQTASGTIVNPRLALKNTTVYRCVSLISYAIGMLPLHLLRGDDFDSDKAADHPLYDVLYSEPNNWQTAFDFRSHMQLNALLYGNAFALVIRSRGRVIRLVPICPDRVEPVQDDVTWAVRYRIDGGRLIEPEDMFHLRALSLDGISGMSLVRQAAEAIGLALSTEEAASRLFRNGMLVGGAITHPKNLGDAAYRNLRDSLEARYAGAENAHRWLILEEGMEPKQFAGTAEDNQHLEMRKHQIEEIARTFGVPRPLLGVDDTSWGTGIEQLGIGFVRYGLSNWFTAWEQAIRRTLLVGDEKKTFKPKFNEGALLRGSLKDQADFFAKALGSGGHQPWMHVDEVRSLMNLKARDDLSPPAGQAPAEESNDEPPASS
ncbi:phage portal protein [Mongoliimonas terrestris]|uniref:phage portal protein n=1 Tax=Mongoliimonas terrestris TaxID=1709001 RepID=UPI0009496A7A|nr:phage portal protein [Mongoliimonas terrestris]